MKEKIIILELLKEPKTFKPFSAGDEGVQSSWICYWLHLTAMEHHSSEVLHSLNVTLYLKNEALFRFLIKDEHGTPVFRIEGPCWTGSCMGSDVEFKVLYVGSDEQVFIFILRGLLHFIPCDP